MKHISFEKDVHSLILNMLYECFYAISYRHLDYLTFKDEYMEYAVPDLVKLHEFWKNKIENKRG